MNIVDIKKIQKLIGSEGGAAIVVDSLPTENIKPNVIYAVKKIDYYTSLYGTKMPTLTATNSNAWVTEAEEILKSKGLTDDEISILTEVGSIGFVVTDISVSDEGIKHIVKNFFENNVFSYEYSSGFGELKGVSYTFNTVVELYEYLFSNKFANEIAPILNFTPEDILLEIDALKSLNFKYQTTPLTADEIGVVAQETYDYAIYNGKEWVKLGEDVVIKEITNEQESNPNSITFTMEEFDKLWNGAQLVLKSTSLPLWQVCYVVQKMDLTTSPILPTKLLLYRTEMDFTIDDYDNVNDISFGITIGENKIPTVFGYEKYYKPKTNKNVSIDWQEDDTYKSLGYNYRGAVQGYNGNTAIITFSPEDAASGNFSTFGTGGGADTNYVYYVYAKSLPDHTIVVNITVL